jgi:SAM-dependent methyltransferase
MQNSEALSASDLVKSDIVVNGLMNRDRGFLGVNSYSRELKMDLDSWLRGRAAVGTAITWYDACCGRGRALTEAASILDEYQPERWVLQGSDLLDDFVDHGADVRLTAADAVTFRTDAKFDLITCVHGIDYLGDKLGFLQNAYQLLAPGGVLCATMDLSNVMLNDRPVIGFSALLNWQGVKLKFRDYLLRIERNDVPLTFKGSYAGATPSSTPNYTGNQVIDSWYRG